MIETKLPLFTTEECNTSAPIDNKLQVITEEKVVAPLVEVLNAVRPTYSSNPNAMTSKSLNKSLDDLFPEQKYEEKNLKITKDALGAIADTFTLEQLNDVIAELQYLSESWLDDFERKIFHGVTLTELLHEKGGI